MPNDNESDPEVIAKSAAVVEAFTQEKYAYLLSLLPTPEGFAQLHNRLEENYPAALKKDPEKLKVFAADSKAMKSELSLLEGLAKVVAHKDASVPESLGLGRATEKPTSNVVNLIDPRNFRITFDKKGQIFASMARVPGAKGYELWTCDGEPSIEANWKLHASSPNCRGIRIHGLNRAKFNVLRVRAMRGHAGGPWSNWVTLEPS